MRDSDLGDPARMRALANDFRNRGHSVGSVATDLSSRVAATRFEGPAANLFRLMSNAKQSEGHRIARELSILSHTMTREAARAEAELAKRRAQRAAG